MNTQRKIDKLQRKFDRGWKIQLRFSEFYKVPLTANELKAIAKEIEALKAKRGEFKHVSKRDNTQKGHTYTKNS
jgi:hypothetical protein